MRVRVGLRAAVRVRQGAGGAKGCSAAIRGCSAVLRGCSAPAA